MRVVTPGEMARVDRAAIEGESIAGLTLMENAGASVARAARDMLSVKGGRRVAVFCGKGNNAGDGFVVARLLAERGVEVVVFLVADPGELKGDASENFKRLESLPLEIERLPVPGEVQAAAGPAGSFDLAVDALFGTGFSGTAEGVFEAAIRAINGAGCPVLAVDIPSGVCGLTGAAAGPAVRADRTVTFVAPKVGLVQYPGAFLAGEMEVADIGIPGRLLETVPDSQIFTVGEEEAEALLPRRPADAHKNSCGRVLVVGGSPGLTGAAALCARAALRCGAGLVTLGVPEGVHDILEVKLTEVMTRPLPQTCERVISLKAVEEVTELSRGFDVLALGPGLSTVGEAPEAVRELVRAVRVPLVLDADGLNAMAGHTEIFEKRGTPLVLTPHAGEMARLRGVDTTSVQSDRLGVARDAAAAWGAVVVLKGAGTVVAEPAGNLRIISSGNPGMATAGMGDVLTGCIASFMAQGLSAFEAAVAGVFYHGHAADLAASMDGMIGMIAGDVIRHLPLALRRGVSTS